MPRDLFTIPIDAIKFDDIREMASVGAEESVRLEFKQSLSTRDGQPDRWMLRQEKIGANARDDIAKEVVAFANAYGGVLIVGIEDAMDDDQRSRKIHSPMIPRVKDCAEQLLQALRAIIDPPLSMLEARGIVGGTDGEGVIVIKVPQSPSAPCGFGRPPLAYVRRGANSEPMTMHDLQSIFFERRTRFERVETRRQKLSHESDEIFTSWSRGSLIKPDEQAPFAPATPGLLFRCSLVPLEDMGIDNMPDRFIGEQNQLSPRPEITERSLVELPQWTHQWRRAYRAVEYLNTLGNIRFSRATIHADGVIDLLGIRADSSGQIFVPLAAPVIAQGMVLCEWMRQWNARPDVEYALDGNLRVNGVAWLYVALRIVHSFVQATVNIVVLRFAIFMAASVVLLAMAVRAALAVL